MTTIIGPRDQTAEQLIKVEVELLIAHGILLRCAKCGQVWSAWVGASGHFARNYWRCPKGCNGVGADMYNPWKKVAPEEKP